MSTKSFRTSNEIINNLPMLISRTRYTHKKVSEMANSADLHSPQCQQHILNLMLAPVKSYASLFTVLALPSYLPLLHTQSYPTRRSVAGVVAQNILKNQTKISTPEHAEGVFELLRVLIREGAQQQAGYPGAQAPRKGRDIETDETVEEQGRLARIVHLLCSDNNDTQFKVGRTFNDGSLALLIIRIVAPANSSESVQRGW